MKLFHEFNKEKLEQIRHDPYFADAVANIRKIADDAIKTDPARIKFSEIHLFATTGNRTVFQRVYENYQGRMEALFFAYLLDEDEKYLEPLSDILWNIMDFESWSIPAHVLEHLPEARRKINLDLCSTILASRIAEIIYFIGDKLPELIVKRAKYEVRTRLIESYRDNDDYGWMRTTNNWSAVCIAATLMTYLYLAEPEEIEAQLPRMMKTADCYLQGIDDEGCCTEGYGYWNYGFSHYCMFASMLRDYTDGKIDLFKNEKVHALAKFQQNVSINATQSISFSDCGMTFAPSAWISHFLKNEYPDIEIPSLPATRGTSLRCVVWCDPKFANCEMKPKSFTYHEAQWFIHRFEAYNFACKAGCNNESHNHNDVGSFILSKNGKVSFCDPGGGEYTRQYFSGERYNILACSARGHSLPIINGCVEQTEKEKAAVRIEKENEYAFEMKQTYPVESLKSLDRHFLCGEKAVTLTDTFKFSEKPESIVERFVSLIEPEDLGGGAVKVGDSVLHYDPALYELSFGSEGLTRSPGRTDIVHFVDLAVKNPEENTVCRFTFE